MNDMNSRRHSLINGNDALLIIIDMQERLLPVIAEKERIVENAVKLVRFSRIAGIPVVVTEQQNLGNTIHEIHDELRDIQPVGKLHFNCFGSDEFSERISQSNRNTLILAGIEAHICVAQTALHAVSDYAVHVVSDAISSRSLHNKEVAIRRMQQQGVTITSTEMFIYEILARAGTDDFREVLKLVK